ncbi:hypothetical protein FKG94_07620 [Exilibacterium tricleocarpae]|uniref:Uncharacterized protein n=1 Tax=Exilibacterium tricleocarpae TaxID=2591008 RepID=A0A545TZE4_9GAMM|nr:hypothetical protein [Exilibacterium tricleocarpae]TQV82592.1 hypothetical protein FKG94_07620 [Exilibacterium tricleocarpae]
MTALTFLYSKSGIKLCCIGLVATVVAIYLVITGLSPPSPDDYYKIVSFADIGEDKPFYTDWNGDTLLIVKPSAARLEQASVVGVNKNKDVVDPPVRTDRHRFAYKVFLLERNRGYLMLGLKRWHSGQIPCFKLNYVSESFNYGGRQLAGGFKCNGSLDDWWEDKLVFDVLGRSQSRFVPDLYMPYYDVTDSEVIVGKRPL